jgi:hypothetical protein
MTRTSANPASIFSEERMLPPGGVEVAPSREGLILGSPKRGVNPSAIDLFFVAGAAILPPLREGKTGARQGTALGRSGLGIFFLLSILS